MVVLTYLSYDGNEVFVGHFPSEVEVFGWIVVFLQVFRKWEYLVAQLRFLKGNFGEDILIVPLICVLFKEIE